jgi:ABC-type polysaccharide/polyol phosphate transport system ATPase subunit
MAIIEVRNVTKEFQLGQLQNARLAVARAAARFVGRSAAPRPRLRALDNIDFTIEQGEVVGIIGRNGAGKSTLLKLLSRISVPTQGTVTVRGRVAPLIEVGAGLVRDLTGRENIYLNATILGMSRREIARKFDDIVSFAELEAFLDTPLKRYSSGMAVRLGFSIATSVDAGILIVDEVLAVGDIAFQRKCLDRMERIIDSGDRTILVVGHNIRQLERICSRMMLLQHGKLVMDADPTSVCRAFFEETERQIAVQTDRKAADIRATHDAGVVTVQGIEILGAHQTSGATEIPLHGAVRIRLTVLAYRPIVRPEIVVGAHTPDLVYVFSMSSALSPTCPDLPKGLTRIECTIPDVPLRPGQYALRIAILDQMRHILWYGENLHPFHSVPGRIDVTRIPELGLTHLKCDWTFTEIDEIVPDRTSEIAMPGGC